MKTLLATIGLSIIVLSGCITHNSAHRYRKVSSGWADGGASYVKFSSFGGKNSTINEIKQAKPNDERAMIYDAYINMDVKKPDTTSARLAALAKKYNGYVLEAGTGQTKIRVPASSLKEAMADIEKLGRVTSKTIEGKDVTEAIADDKIRLENAEKARKRYLELLEKAANVDETLKVEKELERLNGEIDLLKGRMNRLVHLVDYSTISVVHDERKKPGVIGYVFVGLYRGIKWLFVRN